ncbi:GNAT family N-acetyltransferase [Bifidobacterium callitrichidarum]|uniref:N-acetyltransferase domain-containing protein n=1 Tax=Bifidobacterium callitrichidarum TaxID=2052941 RepID=A0A2U2N934_9BIFI|nr:GNAT family N-acetyltransferase [Bifidobacterium callitrichidarum]PWG65600.1 hypothetical protein DF196_06615 [Bifidobacterium callitrichidarum]
MNPIREWTDIGDSRFSDVFGDFRCAEHFANPVPDAAESRFGYWAYRWQSEVEDFLITSPVWYDPSNHQVILYVESDEECDYYRILGICWVELSHGDGGYYIAYIARRLDEREHGIGGKLLAHALKFISENAKIKGFSRETSALIDYRNTESRRLFERFGFAEPGDGRRIEGRYLEYFLPTNSPVWDSAVLHETG